MSSNLARLDCGFKSPARESSYQNLNKTGRIDAGRNVNIWLDSIHSDRFEPIASGHDTVNGVTAIADRLTASEFPIGLYVDAHVLRLQK